jgi:IclR family acetate operon transcriptional repressor
MAFLPPTEIEPMLRGELARRTSASLHKAELLEAQFLQIRATGYATDDEENAEGVRCVAAPIFDCSGYPIAAISISGHAGQIPIERFAALGMTVRTAVDAVSRRLGYQP